MIFKLILITTALIAAAFALIGIKMFIFKDGVFTQTCSSEIAVPDGTKLGCTCDENPGYTCENYEEHHGIASQIKKLQEEAKKNK
ncbi:MAG: hypothetical protein JW857_05320 [Bacteroidales bacterium]|nr:hypothetical protein [Bacteroidales bacterium]